MMIKFTKKRLPIILILLFLMVLPLVLKANLNVGSRTAYASTITSDYTMGDGSYSLKEDKAYFSPLEGCTYVFTIKEDINFPIEEIRFSAYQVYDYQDIYYDKDGNIENDFAKDKNGEEMDNVLVEFLDDSISFNQHGKRNLNFEITMYEWAAFQIDVHYKDSETQEAFVEQSDFIYCTSIDSSPPFIYLYPNPVFVGNGYRFEFRVTSNSQKDYRSADSGLKSVRVYRNVDGEEETVKEYTSFSTSTMLDAALIAVKGEYWIEAYDKVDNHSFGRVIKIDYDIETLNRIYSVDTVLRNAEEYRADLIENLREKYIDWQLLSLDKDNSKETVKAARLEVMEAQRLCAEAERLFEVELLNSNYFDGDIVVENFKEANFTHTVKGEKATLQIAFAEYDLKRHNFNVLLEAAKMQDADFVLALDIKTLSDIKKIQKTDFEEEIEITIPIKNYKKVVALLETQAEGGKQYSKLKIDEGVSWVKVYVPSTHQKVHLVIQTDESSNNLYWLFLLLIIPIGVIVVLLRKKIFKSVAKKCEDKDNQNQPKPSEKKTPKPPIKNKFKKK